MRYRLFLVPLLVVGLAGPARAGIIFGKKPPKPPPEKRVPELLAVVKSDGDESKRVEAVDELRQFDLAAFPQIVPTLIDVLLTDKKPAVRAAAAQTLGKLRPVSQQVGLALEHTRDKDASMRVRMQARSSLLSYHWAGFWSSPGNLKQDGPPPPKTTEPPLAPPLLPVTPPSQTTEPPLAPPPAVTPPPAPVIRTNPGAVLSLPKGPPTPPPAEPAPPPVKAEQGPELGPPQ